MSKKSRSFVLLPLLLAAVSLAITQESAPVQASEDGEGRAPDAPVSGEPPEEQAEIPAVPLPEWVKPARWFRSNSAGMALEEIPSRFAALRNEYALVIDFLGPDELPEILSPFYNDDYFIETHVLYKKKEESRRQWIFRDTQGLSRLIAVFFRSDAADSAESETGAQEDSSAKNAPEDLAALGEDEPDQIALADESGAETALDSAPEDNPDAAESAEDFSHREIVSGPRQGFSGFIEIYNEDSMLLKEIVFSDDTGERETEYLYRRGALVGAESVQKSYDSGEEIIRKIYTDQYRYNRSGSLRAVERVYHERVDDGFVRLSFPYRVLDAAAEGDFIAENLFMDLGFSDSYTAEAGQKMVFTTDDRGRILSQTLLDMEGKEIWAVKNTWSGERIVSAVRTEGDDVRINEFEYNSGGERISERNFHNGILERQVRINGGSEVEELFINGVVVLRAVWEDGRKISEQRVQTGERMQ